MYFDWHGCSVGFKPIENYIGDLINFSCQMVAS